MHIFKKRLLVVPAAFAAAAIFAGPIGVAADAPAPVDLAVFSGATSGLTPVDYVGGSGHYGFNTSSLLGCTVVSGDDLTPQGCTVTSNGKYQSILCGTGIAAGSAAITETPSGTVDNVNYDIFFVGGVGILTPQIVTLKVKDVDGSDSAAPNVPALADLPVGVVDISAVPSLPGGDGGGEGIVPSAVGDCVQQFNVVVAAVLAAS